MERSDKILLISAQYFVLVTSIIFAILKYFFQVEGEWGLQDHPLTKFFQHIHILSVPFLVFFVGVIFKSHIWKRLSTGFKKLRKTGILLIVGFLLMVFSGYGIQVAMEKSTRDFLIWVHLISCGLWSVLFIYHQLKGSTIVKTRIHNISNR